MYLPRIGHANQHADRLRASRLSIEARAPRRLISPPHAAYYCFDMAYEFLAKMMQVRRFCTRCSGDGGHEEAASQASAASRWHTTMTPLFQHLLPILY